MYNIGGDDYRMRRPEEEDQEFPFRLLNLTCLFDSQVEMLS